MAQILRANVLTRFNAILGALFVIVMVVGPPQDGLFGVVLVVNTLIGVLQEIRAKQTLDRLSLLSAPTARAIRDGRQVDLQMSEIVLDDLLELGPGDQVVADGVLVDSAGLEVDESLLSGESWPVGKAVGDPVMSGSAAVAGRATMRVKAVGDNAYAQRLQGEARRFSLVRSELQKGTNRILRAISWIMVPVGVLLVTGQFVRSGQGLSESVRGSVAGVGAMVPEGLVLLTTIAFALGAIRLARRRVLVQELAAIEGLARVDVVCIDKTGTLTEPGMTLAAIASLDSGDGSRALGAMAAADETPNATMLAARSLAAPAGWHARGGVPFSPIRKWSAVDFGEHGWWVVGAPEIVAPHLSGDGQAWLTEQSATGRRVLAVVRSTGILGDELPADRTPSALVAFEERLRGGAPATVAYLLEQGIGVMVVSGDSAATAGAVATRVGVPGADRPVDARWLPDDTTELAETIESVGVLGRVRPEQKRAIVQALQSRGHVVAMTGDGVNDIPALKAADLGMAMGSGTAATRAVGRLVLLDDAFTVFPQIVDEGRRVIANVERIANLFVTKTVYAVWLALVAGLVALPYPFYPRHLTVVSSVTIGIPGFFLAFAPGAPRSRPGFLASVLRFTLPAGTVMAAATLTSYLVARGPFGATGLQARTTATFTLLALGLVVLWLVARPVTLCRALLVASMAAAAAILWEVPVGRRIFGLGTPPAGALSAAAGVVVVGSVAVVGAVALVGRLCGTGDQAPVPPRSPTVSSSSSASER